MQDAPAALGTPSWWGTGLSEQTILSQIRDQACCWELSGSQGDNGCSRGKMPHTISSIPPWCKAAALSSCCVQKSAEEGAMSCCPAWMPFLSCCSTKLLALPLPCCSVFKIHPHAALGTHASGTNPCSTANLQSKLFQYC